MLKVLILGANGQLGIELLNSLTHSHNVLALKKSDCDITEIVSLRAYFTKFKPDVVINAAAYTKVDLAESNPKEAFSINASAVENIAHICKDFDALLISFSTDYVFDGILMRPYSEIDATFPINVYGASKREGETRALAAHKKTMIVRTSGVYSVHGHNFVKSIFKAIQEKNTLKVVSDQKLSPTSTNSIASFILAFLVKYETSQGFMPTHSIYHYADKSEVNWFEFAKKIHFCAKKSGVKLLCNLQNIKKSTSEEYGSVSARPTNSILNCSLASKEFNFKLRTLDEELTKVVDKLASRLHKT